MKDAMIGDIVGSVYEHNNSKANWKENTAEPAPCGMNVAVLTYQNVDRLKHEVAFYNPENLNPDQMLNHILNNYFKMVTEARRTTR